MTVGATTITFDPTVFATPQTTTLTGGQLTLANPDTITITGPAAGLTISGNNASRVFNINSGDSATLSGLTITGGNGGGVVSKFSSTVTLTSCVISGNNGGGNGGVSTSAASGTLINCTVSGNTGGGIVAYRWPDQPDQLHRLRQQRAGITLREATGTLNDCTVTGNAVGIANSSVHSSALTLGNTIVAGNSGVTNPDIDSLITIDNGHNLLGTALSGRATGAGDIFSDTPLLAPLGNYGGPTQTMALLPGSPAIDAGNNALIPAGVTTDQRGLPRIVNGTVDIGAFESSGFTIAVTSGSGQSTGVIHRLLRPAGRDGHRQQPERARGGRPGHIHPAGERGVGDPQWKPGDHQCHRHGERHRHGQRHRR